MASVLKSCLFAASMACIAGFAVAAEEGAVAKPETGKTQMCVRGSLIDQSPAVDAKTIVLKMKNGTYKRMDLVNSCSQLMFGHGFIYESSTDELCTSSQLRINDIAGGSCMIKQIVDISKEEGKYLLSKEYKDKKSAEKKGG
jgi:hypothetical protein